MTVALTVCALWKACISVGPNFVKGSFDLKLALDSLWCWKEHDHKWCWLANAESCCKGLEGFRKIIYHPSLPLLSFLLNSLFSLLPTPTQKCLIIRCRVIHPPLTVHWIEQIQLRLWLPSLSEFPFNKLHPNCILDLSKRCTAIQGNSWLFRKNSSQLSLESKHHRNLCNHCSNLICFVNILVLKFWFLYHQHT